MQTRERLNLTLKTDKQRYGVAEPIKVSVVAHNGGQAALFVVTRAFGFMWLEHDSTLAIWFAGMDAKSSAFSPVAAIQAIGSGDSLELHATIEFPYSEFIFERKGILLPHPRQIDPKGPFQLIAHVGYASQPFQPGGGIRNLPLEMVKWQSIASSEPLPIERSGETRLP